MGKAEAYKILKVPPGCSKARIRKAYIELMKLSHPDVSSEQDSTQIAVTLNAAYEELMQVCSINFMLAKLLCMFACFRKN